ncbi:MAG: DUF4234 domain-containing protein [Oribacterium sp.]|nr:DUF4234 domain-containing protein [Oribacterium sp.]
MFCTNCGQKLEDGMKFCPNCGQPVTPETAATANASALSTETAATANASALGADDAVVETVESTTAASVATEDTPAAAYTESSSESAPAGRMDEASAAPAGDSASEMSAETPAENVSAETPLGNTTEQYKRRLEEGHAASGTEGNTSGAAHSTHAGATDTRLNGSTTQSHSGSSDQTQPNSGTAQQQTPPPVNHGPAVNGVPSEPDGNGTIRTVGLILLILTVLFAVPQIWTTIASFFRIIQNLFSFSYHGFVNLMYSFLNFILNVVKLAGYGFIGGGMYLVWKKWSDRDAEPLLMTVIAGGVMLVLEALLRGIISALFQRYYAIGSASWGIGFAILAIVLLVVLITQKQLNPFAGLAGNFADGLRRDLDRVTDLAQGKSTSAAYGSGYDTSTFGGSDAQQTTGAGASDAQAHGAADDSIGAQAGSADHSTAGGQTTADAGGNFNRYYQSQSQPGGGYTGPLKTDRSLVLYILLGILTCGIYQLYVFYTIMRDVNVACDGDGRHTPGLLEFILFGILTCGIYDLYWFYSVGNRLADNAPRYGLHFQENGTTLLLWMLIGSLLCFIGSYVGIYFLLNNVNAICSAYNQQR